MSGNNNNTTQPSDFDLQAALDASHALSQAVDSSASAPVNTQTVSQPSDVSDYDLDAALKASEESLQKICAYDLVVIQYHAHLSYNFKNM